MRMWVREHIHTHIHTQHTYMHTHTVNMQNRFCVNCCQNSFGIWVSLSANCALVVTEHTVYTELGILLTQGQRLKMETSVNNSAACSALCVRSMFLFADSVCVEYWFGNREPTPVLIIVAIIDVE